MKKTRISGKDIMEQGTETDYAGYPIDPEQSYMVDHINAWGEPEYITVAWWENSQYSDPVSEIAPEFEFLFKPKSTEE